MESLEFLLVMVYISIYDAGGWFRSDVCLIDSSTVDIYFCLCRYLLMFTIEDCDLFCMKNISCEVENAQLFG